jgi:hypothetical protein
MLFVVQVEMALIYKTRESCGGMVSGLQLILIGVEAEMEDSDSWMV